MTNREFLTAIASNTTIPAELVEYATERLAKMDAANEARKNKPRKVDAEKAAFDAQLTLQILTEVLTTEAMTAAQIAEALGVKSAKVTPLMRPLVAEGTVTVTDVKIPNAGMRKAYALAD